jgi:hypothetical protein
MASHLSIRYGDTTIEQRLEEHRRRLKAKKPGFRITISGAARDALERGLKAAERAAAKRKGARR